jgi:hypothetical protein
MKRLGTGQNLSAGVAAAIGGGREALMGTRAGNFIPPGLFVARSDLRSLQVIGSSIGQVATRTGLPSH